MGDEGFMNGDDDDQMSDEAKSQESDDRIHENNKYDFWISRNRNGQCPTCGAQVRCTRGGLFIPLNNEYVLEGRCLLCCPLPGTVRPQEISVISKEESENVSNELLEAQAKIEELSKVFIDQRNEQLEAQAKIEELLKIFKDQRNEIQRLRSKLQDVNADSDIEEGSKEGEAKKKVSYARNEIKK